LTLGDVKVLLERKLFEDVYKNAKGLKLPEPDKHGVKICLKNKFSI
jgi:hypothetical protein